MTYCVACVDINVGLKMLQDFVQVSCSRCAQKRRITVRLKLKKKTNCRTLCFLKYSVTINNNSIITTWYHFYIRKFSLKETVKIYNLQNECHRMQNMEHVMLLKISTSNEYRPPEIIR